MHESQEPVKRDLVLNYYPIQIVIYIVQLKNYQNDSKIQISGEANFEVNVLATSKSVADLWQFFFLCSRG